MTSSFVPQFVSDTTHRAWSAWPIYVASGPIARISRRPIASKEPSSSDAAKPVEIAVERPGDEAVDDQPTHRFSDVSPPLVNRARRNVSRDYRSPGTTGRSKKVASSPKEFSTASRTTPDLGRDRSSPPTPPSSPAAAAPSLVSVLLL
jgi:hypothetical protein